MKRLITHFTLLFVLGAVLYFHHAAMNLFSGTGFNPGDFETIQTNL